MNNAPNARRTTWSWAFYDWANSGFATVVLAGFFPILFQDYWSADVPAAQANLRLGWANGLASVVIIAMAPIIGALADRAGWRKRALLIFAMPAALMTTLLALVPAGDWWLAAVVFVLATVGFMAANLFYDSLLLTVAQPADRHFVSGLGFGLGYLGGGLLYLGCVLAVLNPAWFGLETALSAALIAFVMTGVWWALFTLPLMVGVPEPVSVSVEKASLRGGLQQVLKTLKHLRGHRSLWMFLLAYWLYIDAVGTTIRMAVAYGRALGFEQNDLIVALLITQFVGFPAAIAMGAIGTRVGAKWAIMLTLAGYVGICIWGAFIRSPWEFYAIAALVGLVQGGVQSLSRSLYAGLIPAERAGEFFGLYNLLGKSAALIGPPLFGLMGVWFGDVRYSMLALIVLFIAGALLLTRVDPEENYR